MTAHPRIQRRTPAPFNRPSVNVGAADVHREWRSVSVLDIQAGDIVPGLGIIRDVEQVFAADAERPFVVWIRGGIMDQPTAKQYLCNDSVFAFAATPARQAPAPDPTDRAGAADERQ